MPTPIALCLLLSLPVAAAPSPLAAEPAAPALAAKVPGAPGYGLQVTGSNGKYIFTNLYCSATEKTFQAKLYRIHGNAGLGPYRLGVTLGFHHDESAKNTTHLPAEVFSRYFYINSVEKGSAADKAGLGVTAKTGHAIEMVDGSTFDWDLASLAYHITTVPEVEIRTFRLTMFSNIVRKTFRIQTAKRTEPVDPGDGEPVLATSAPADVVAWINQSQTWRDLLRLRSTTAPFTPLAFDLAGRKLWVVKATQDPALAKGPKPDAALEFWTRDPLEGDPKGLMDVWPVADDGLAPGRILRIGDQWHRIQTLALDPATGRLAAFELRPWVADVPGLLRGATLAKELDTQKGPNVRESLEQAGNDALLEWKTRTMAAWMAQQKREPMEDLVIGVEKGMLGLDLEVKGIRNRLDAQARAEAERKAQAELAAKNGQPPPPALPALAESERVADLLDQRKAILMAILGNAKQTLATLKK